LPPLTLSVV